MKLIFIVYLVSLLLIFFSVTKQLAILMYSTNGTRFTQKTFLLFNVCFFLFVLGRLLELADFNLWHTEELRASLVLLMSAVGFVFYSQGTKRNEK